MEREDRHERRKADGPQHRILECARADAVRGEQNDRRDRRLDAVEQPGHERHVAEREVDPRQRNEDEQRRQHEEAARYHSTPGPVHHPADIGGELLGLRARQHHAVVERVQEALLGDPAFPLYQILVHDRDLPGWAAEADEAELEPVAESLGKGYRGGLGLRTVAHAAGLY